jgi:hypothetical protein
MESRKPFLICVCSVLTIALILSSASRVDLAQASTPTVSVVPSLISTFLGQDLTVDIDVSTVSDLYAWEFALSWNATLFDAINVVMSQYSKINRQFRVISDYDVDNVSKKVVRIIMSYTDYINRTVWYK